ncbi:MAG: hypothetical protein ACMUHY_08010 [Thermoplasmatota archaeon]
MRCDRAVTLLASVRDMKEIDTDRSDISELTALGLITRTGAESRANGSESQLARMRSELKYLGDRKKEIDKELENIGRSGLKSLPRSIFKKNARYKDLVGEKEAIVEKERELRSRIIDVVQTSTESRYNALVNGEPTILTFKGKEALVTMEQRGRRISRQELKSFLSEIEAARKHFQSRSRMARDILKTVSPSYPSIDEIHLRMLAVGLSGRKGGKDEIAGLFKEAMDRLELPFGLRDSTEMVLAETLVIASRDKEDLRKKADMANRLCRESFKGYSVSQDQIRAVGIILSSGEDIDYLVRMTKVIATDICPDMYSPAALVACSRDSRALSNFRSILSERSLGSSGEGTTMASAIVSVSGLPVEVIVERFREAMSRLRSLGLKDMEITAAMLSVLPFDIEESMDNLRMASHSISLNRLSLGAVENISLGMKLLMTTSVMSTGIKGAGEDAEMHMGSLVTDAPIHLALQDLLVLNALTMTASMNAFHEISIHRTAVSDYRFHPVHSHYVYG